MTTTIDGKRFRCPGCGSDTIEKLSEARVSCEVVRFAADVGGVLFPDLETDPEVEELTGVPQYRCGICGRTLDLRELPEMVVDTA
jgi:DNA-directed RNA polymerase subunit RPC12/RpoP